MGAQEGLLLGILALGWVLASRFVPDIVGRTRGSAGFVLWLLASLVFSPLLAAISLVAVLQFGVLERLDYLTRLPANGESPTLAGGRFSHVVGG